MEWLCPVCETINNNNNTETMSELEKENVFSKKLCRICYNKYDEDIWEMQLAMNKQIDLILPRHNHIIDISYPILNTIKLVGPVWYRHWDTLDYVKRRLLHRNRAIWQKWKRQVNYRKVVKILLNNWNKNFPRNFDESLILKFLF
tara:strand:- start:1208 stop:1642 length:435 start_codon:yes stop_codon:yes gene_type:complete